MCGEWVLRTYTRLWDVAYVPTHPTAPKSVEEALGELGDFSEPIEARAEH